ncbi:MAG: class I SAM-dependent methyltransferase [Thermoplasmata archaeon]|nr:class I SAM-dependent methyltransferase [Thermoplasmata archaeon]
MPSAASIERREPLETLMRWAQRGPAGLPALRDLAVRGDWTTRALALSAMGRIVREDASAWRRDSLRHRIAPRVAWIRARWPSAGPRGSFVSGLMVDALLDRVWIVRVAACLALGECRDGHRLGALRPLLADLVRPVRLAAAAALAACGSPPDGGVEALVAGADPAPERIGDTSLSLEWLGRLVAAHGPVLEAWTGAGPRAPAQGDSAAWARFLAGDVTPEKVDSREAEILRYATGKDTHYNVTKPFTSISREQNVRLLRAFLTVAENMRVPQNGLVLDLGGGAAWVSDLLAKFGYRPITLDIAPALLRVGRDRFTRENLPFRPVSGDMTAIPIASASVDAVLVVDALHHVPNVPAVFREAFRVLQQGGQFLLAEPGEGHAESEKSRGEMLEHGVCEREIHLAEAVRYGREAGFDDVRIVPHYEPVLAFSPEDFERARTEPSERWRLRIGDRPVSFDTFVVQSILSHPVVVFSKGERPADSRMPRLLRAGLEPALAREGARVRGTVTVFNEGDTLWLRGGDEAGRVRLGVQLLSPERRLLHMDFARGVLPRDVAPGERLEVPLDVVLPEAGAPYVLKLDMVDEHVCWFEDMGSRPVYVAL